MRPVSATGLYWSMDGEVACARHAPQAADSRWSIEGWAPIEVLSGRIQGALYQYQCQHCAADGDGVEREAALSEILERIRVHKDKAADHERRAADHQEAADRFIGNAKRRHAAAPLRHIVRRKRA